MKPLPTPWRAVATSCVVVALLLLGESAHAGFAPLARASADPLEAVVGQSINFSSARSIDPDDGPLPLSFSWDFGDQTSSTEPSPIHAYATPGVYNVTLIADDGEGTGIDVLSVYILAAAVPGAPVNSSPLALSDDGGRIFVVNPDSASVSVIDTVSATLVQEVSVGANPRSVALDDAGRLFVTCQGTNELWVLDQKTLEIITTIAVGHRPYGVVVAPDGTVVVSNQSGGSLTVLNGDSIEEMATLEVGADPRALAVAHDGTTLFVTHFLTRGTEGRVTVVDLVTMSVDARVVLVEDPSPDTGSSGGGFPNLLSAAAVHPTGEYLWFGGLKSNTSRGSFLTGEPLLPTNRVRGMAGRIDIDGRVEDVPRRIDTNNADRVSAIVFSALGRYVYVAHQGIGAVTVYDTLVAEQVDASDGSTVPFVSRIEVGDAPQGLALSPDGKSLYVATYLSRAVAIVDVSDPVNPQLLDSVAATPEPLDPVVAMGKRMFYSSRAPMHSGEGYEACASCHPEGGADGRTWDTTNAGEGLRNTIDLRGRGGMDHGPVHWSANFDEIQDFERDIVHSFGGTGLSQDGEPPYEPLDGPSNAGRSEELDALAAFVSTLTTPVPRPPGGDSAANARGKAIYNDDAVGCFACHQAPRFTDSRLTDDPADYVLHDVGTLQPGSGMRLGGPLRGLDTPTHIGLWNTAPYLHDGSATTLMDVITVRNLDDRHGRTSHLTEGELDDLVAYLLSIDSPLELVEESPGVVPDDTAPLPAGGCGCFVTGSGETRWTWFYLIAAQMAMMAYRRNRRA